MLLLSGRISSSLCFVVLALSLVAASGIAQAPLAQNEGDSGLLQQLQKLKTTARLMHTTAHPDDEDGGMMTLESRGRGASVLLMTLTRGEGGQNKFGGEITDELGILRTLELLEADRYYGVEQRFSRVADFGFSKNADETFQKWGGHEVALDDMVRVIRTFRPDVLVSRFQGAARDGHGNHQAAGIVTREAFRAAADPNRFPEQLREGLLPWQAKKLYMDNVHADEDWTLRLDTGAYDPVLGTGFQQFALEGLSHQISQGVGGLRVPPGHRYTYYKLIDSTLETKPGPGQHEEDFFDGIDTSLPALAARLGAEQAKLPGLNASLRQLAGLADAAVAAFDPHDPSRCAAPLLTGLAVLQHLFSDVERSSLSAPARRELLIALHTKAAQFDSAALLALGSSFEAVVDSGKPAPEPGRFPVPENTFQFAIPGQTFYLNARYVNRGKQRLHIDTFRLNAPSGWSTSSLSGEADKDLDAGDSATARFQITVPADAAYTRPYWRRDDTQAQNVVVLDDASEVTRPLSPGPLTVVALVRLPGSSPAKAPAQIEAVPQTKRFDPDKGQQQHPLTIGPMLSVEIEPQSQVIRTGGAKSRSVTVGVTSYAEVPTNAQVALSVPPGWTVDPRQRPANFSAAGEHNTYDFQVTPVHLHEQLYAVSATADAGGHAYREGFRSVGRDDIGSYPFYRPAKANISAVDVMVPPHLRVGYIMGPGDEIPSVLRQIGIDVQLIPDLSIADLAEYDTVVLGIRAYDVRADLRDNNRKLLDFVAHGGTLVAQYNQSQNLGSYMPYPATAGRDRVTVEEAPVTVLAPADPIFHSPNQITAHDFDGWVQERGLYFLHQWDPHYQPLLASHDPGEAALEGGMLEAKFGRGTYIYTGYAFFRQLPAGVPGAIRLFVNLLCAGRPVQ